MWKKTKNERIKGNLHKYASLSSTPFYPLLCFYWNYFWKHTSLLFWLMLSSVIVLVISCDPICQWIILDLFRSQIRIASSLIRVRCCMSCIHYASFISNMVIMPMNDGQSPQLVRRYLNRAFIFLLLWKITCRRSCMINRRRLVIFGRR
ncbi:hypothetical protein N665_2435s0002 [Sinapis alba]|nr:hypothetical protein N665_2435s0002 [Sinapis alba]